MLAREIAKPNRIAGVVLPMVLLIETGLGFSFFGLRFSRLPRCSLLAIGHRRLPVQVATLTAAGAAMFQGSSSLSRLTGCAPMWANMRRW
jgi:hypothetical protein